MLSEKNSLILGSIKLERCISQFSCCRDKIHSTYNLNRGVFFWLTVSMHDQGVVGSDVKWHDWKDPAEESCSAYVREKA